MKHDDDQMMNVHQRERLHAAIMQLVVARFPKKVRGFMFRVEAVDPRISVIEDQEFDTYEKARDAINAIIPSRIGPMLDETLSYNELRNSQHHPKSQPYFERTAEAFGIAEEDLVALIINIDDDKALAWLDDKIQPGLGLDDLAAIRAAIPASGLTPGAQKRASDELKSIIANH